MLVLNSNSNDSNAMQERDLLSNLLQLCLNCLLFDFIGTTSNEDTSDDLSTVQIPTTWRSSILIIILIPVFLFINYIQKSYNGLYEY